MTTDTRPVKRIAPAASLDSAIAAYTAHGWQITSRAGDAVQLRRPKQWDIPLLAVGTVGLLFGFGLVYLIFALLDRIMQGERLMYLTAAQAQAGQLPSPRVGSNWLLFGLATAITAAGGFLLLLALAS